MKRRFRQGLSIAMGVNKTLKISKGTMVDVLICHHFLRLALNYMSVIVYPLFHCFLNITFFYFTTDFQVFYSFVLYILTTNRIDIKLNFYL